MTLQTVKSENLQSITISPDRNVPTTIGEADRKGWNDLDMLLVQFWNTHSIRPRVMYPAGRENEYTRDCVPSLLPELTRRGLVDMVQLY